LVREDRPLHRVTFAAKRDRERTDMTPGRPKRQPPLEPDRTSTPLLEIADLARQHETIATAVVDDISPDGVARIVLSGEENWREAASVLRFASRSAAAEALLGRTVLVLLSPSALPVILGAVAPRLWDEAGPDPAAQGQFTLPAGEARSVQADKRHLDLQASDEIRLTCGKSSLVMRRDGTVIVRGVRIVSRATESNKIRGGTVSVN
jgi:hypothetical protein